jgi:uncharacterized membrane protein
MILSKELFHVVSFVVGVVFSVLTLFFPEPLVFGFALLFSVMFIVDSFWFFLKKKFLKDSMSPIGVSK